MKLPTKTTVIKTPWPDFPKDVELRTIIDVMRKVEQPLRDIPLPGGGSMLIMSIVQTPQDEEPYLATQIHYFSD